MKFIIEEIWIDEDANDEALTAQIVGKLPSAKIFKGSDCKDRLRELNLRSDPLSQGKKILRLMKHKGAFVKPCPGTPKLHLLRAGNSPHRPGLPDGLSILCASGLFQQARA